MKTLFHRRVVWATVGFLLLAGLPATGQAAIDGITGTVTAGPAGNVVTFNFTALPGYLSTPEGGSYLFWGYGDDDGLAVAQYPGPTLIIREGDEIVINLKNRLDEMTGVPVSIIAPGLEFLGATGGSPGPVATEVAQCPAGMAPTACPTVTYRFRAARPGTYLYNSGSRMDLEIEMGLFGAVIVRPADYLAGSPTLQTAYGATADPVAGTGYDREYLFLISEMDPAIHEAVEFDRTAALDLRTRHAVYWFINGRASPDTLFPSNIPWMPHQPYGALPQMHPGEKVLMRVANAGSEVHPFHHHGNHSRVLARDGHLLARDAATRAADLQQGVYTIQSVPGQTVDAIFEWTGKGMGWDIYGTGAGFAHSCGDPACPDVVPDPDGDGFGDGFNDTTGEACFDVTTREYCPDHGKPLPVTLPNTKDLAFGGFWGGSPYLGTLGALPPGEGGLNPSAGFTFVWHSHTEKELTNNDIFPGGMLTILIVQPNFVPIP